MSSAQSATARCRHRRILEQGPAGRFCAECGDQVDVVSCGAVHERARAICTLPEGHEGSHANAQGYWMPRPGEHPAAPDQSRLSLGGDDAS